MTDYDKLKELLTSFDVGYTEENKTNRKIIDCEEGSNRVEGYSFFFTRFEFDLNGKFILMGAWE